MGDWEAGGFIRGRWILKDGSIFHGSFDKGLSPAEGAHYLTRTHMLQAGSYSEGAWKGVGQPKLGDVGALATLVN